jgi:hypothetical protein
LISFRALPHRKDLFADARQSGSKVLILTIIFGSLFGLGFFFLIRPGALTTHVEQLHSRLEHGMIWLIRRAQTQHRADLAIAGYQASEMVSRKLATMFIAGASAVGLLVVFQVLSLQISKIFVLIILSSATAIGFFLPDSQMRTKANSRRQDFLHAFSSYLDLVNVLLAGGAGTETALIAAAEAGDGRAHRCTGGGRIEPSPQPHLEHHQRATRLGEGQKGCRRDQFERRQPVTARRRRGGQQMPAQRQGGNRLGPWPNAFGPAHQMR